MFSVSRLLLFRISKPPWTTLWRACYLFPMTDHHLQGVSPGAWRMLEKGTSPADTTGIDVEEEEQDAGGGGARLACRACRQEVTRTGARIRVNGKHSHVFFNPNGNVFEIGCFARATACLGVGPVTSEFTWFTGYAWQVAICLRCHSHLGWIFRSSEKGFYGLILKALIEIAEE